MKPTMEREALVRGWGCRDECGVVCPVLNRWSRLEEREARPAQQPAEVEGGGRLAGGVQVREAQRRLLSDVAVGAERACEEERHDGPEQEEGGGEERHPREAGERVVPGNPTAGRVVCALRLCPWCGRVMTCLAWAGLTRAP